MRLHFLLSQLSNNAIRLWICQVINSLIRSELSNFNHFPKPDSQQQPPTLYSHLPPPCTNPGDTSYSNENSTVSELWIFWAWRFTPVILAPRNWGREITLNWRLAWATEWHFSSKTNGQTTQKTNLIFLGHVWPQRVGNRAGELIKRDLLYPLKPQRGVDKGALCTYLRTFVATGHCWQMQCPFLGQCVQWLDLLRIL
jgi:hypothetical protein